MNGLLQEKRWRYASQDSWLPGSLNSLNLPMVGNITLPSGSSDPENSWDSYRMAAVHSANFAAGPGVRLFYHAQQLNGTSLVQELIWTQKNDSWVQGATIEGAWPNSHLAATIDESIGVLRLFYSTGGGTLQEAWTSLSDTSGTYKNGMWNVLNSSLLSDRGT